MKSKPNLILVNGFPINSRISQGIEEYLKDFFTLYPIYFPGFEKHTKPFDKNTLEQYVSYTQKQIDDLNLDNYIIASISFGSSIVNRLNLSKNCKLLLSAEPFYTIDQFSISKYQKTIIKIILNTVCALKIYNQAWKFIFYNNTLKKLAFSEKPNKYISIVRDDFNPKTFFETAKMLLNFKEVKIKDFPQIVMINPNDELLNSALTTKLLKQNIKTENLRVIIMNQDHYPYPATYNHFKKTFSKNEIQQVFDFYNYLN